MMIGTNSNCCTTDVFLVCLHCELSDERDIVNTGKFWWLREN